MKVLIVGATSAIAQAVARPMAARGDTLFLLARSEERLAALEADLRIRGAPLVGSSTFDAAALERHAALLQQAHTQMGGIDVVLVAYGTLNEQQACERDVGQTLQALHTNGTSVIALLTLLANRFEAQGHGTLAVIGSVAGDRGRQSNYVYGTAKGMLAIFLQGLRNRLHKRGVNVLTIKPGFVDTPMTAAFEKGPLWASPEQIASRIILAIDKGWDVVYAPAFWRLIMLVITTIPERVFKRLSL
jgi:decaprenylphospho-beta-D-erythro-pentofuranosid-2-ulose 2-reductase